MLSPGQRKRLRPGLKSLGLSLVLCPCAVYLGWRFFGYELYLPLLGSLAVALSLAWFRMRGVSSSLPEPYGKGRMTTIDAEAAVRSGLLLVVGCTLAIVGLMGSVYFLPAFAFFAVVIGLTAGLPMSEIVVFVLLTRLERKSRSRIFSVIEETSRDGKDVLVKSVEMAPLSPE